MFDDKIYNDFIKTDFFKKFSLYCYIGFLSAYLVAAVTAVFILKSLLTDFCTVLASVIIIGIVVFALVRRNLKHTPYICTSGEIESVDGNRAVVSINGIKISGTSFEHFLKNNSLEGYATGDKVVIYASSDKLKRPLFYHI